MPGALPSLPGAPRTPAQPCWGLARQVALLLPQLAGGRMQGCKPIFLLLLGAASKCSATAAAFPLVPPTLIPK